MLYCSIIHVNTWVGRPSFFFKVFYSLSKKNLKEYIYENTCKIYRYIEKNILYKKHNYFLITDTNFSDTSICVCIYIYTYTQIIKPRLTTFHNLRPRNTYMTFWNRFHIIRKKPLFDTIDWVREMKYELSPFSESEDM